MKLLDYVSYFRYKLHRACELAMQNLTAAQSKMKGWFYKKATVRHFKTWDKVFGFLPIPWYPAFRHVIVVLIS